MDLVDALNATERALDGELLPAMLDIAQGVADDAKTGHPWRNRTGRLEGSIRQEGASGSLRTGYRVSVTARTPYASFLEEGWVSRRQLWHRDTSGNEIHMGTETATSHWAFLMPAWQRREAWAVEVIDAAMVRALTF